MSTDRIHSLDAFRGITIAGMILVNNPGSWDYVYAPLRHAEWHGWTPTDLVFPFFLFIVGVSISLSFSKRLEMFIGRKKLYQKIMRRSMILFALGILLNLVPRFDLNTLRIPGVLQRIALCYFISALFFIHTNAKKRIVIVFMILSSYWLILKFIPVPGYGAGVLDYQGNLCAYIDNLLLGGHLYKQGFDPEGILSTLPAVATTLLGTLTGDWLRSIKTVFQKTVGLFLMGGILIFPGLLLDPVFPINKQLWTSTYVLFTAGAALILLGICFGVMEGLYVKKWATPFLIYGMNAIFVYVVSSLTTRMIGLIRVSAGGETLPLKSYIYDYLLVPWAGPLNGSLVYPLCLIFIWMIIMIPLYQKKIFIKI